ncbi:reverse transcriptase [Corchorus capsularis]|uniref:Reverse transcriptase n=1 Tax=Corchorus capsularis TaxID=210143 RepID=A0A1R3J938_COCAP|nr:reverse transcriptase [Corchorus capsularis]
MSNFVAKTWRPSLGGQNQQLVNAQPGVLPLQQLNQGVNNQQVPPPPPIPQGVIQPGLGGENNLLIQQDVGDNAADNTDEELKNVKPRAAAYVPPHVRIGNGNRARNDHQRYPLPRHPLQEGPVNQNHLREIIEDMIGPAYRRIGRPSFQKPYSEEYDRLYPLPQGYKVPDFTCFSGTSSEQLTLEHIARFTVQCGEANSGYHKLRLFPNSVTEAAFTWYINLPPNSVRFWEEMERLFHTQFYRTEPEVSMADLSRLYQKKGESAEDYLVRFKKLRNMCRTPLQEMEFVRLAHVYSTPFGFYELNDHVKYESPSSKDPNRSSPIKTARVDNRSFKEALCGSNKATSANGLEYSSPLQNPPSTSSPSAADRSLAPLLLDIDIPKDDLEWLNRSMVGKSYGGVDCIEASLKSHSRTLLRFFDELITWWDDDTDRAALLWIKLEEVPLLLWHQDFFQRLGNGWGKFIKTHESTLSRESFRAAWILVEVESKGDIPNVISGKVSNIPFKIICSTYMAAPGSIRVDGSLSSGESRESPAHSTPSVSLRLMENREAISGSSKEINNFVDNLNEDCSLSASCPLEDEPNNLESPRLENAFSRYLIGSGEHQSWVPESSGSPIVSKKSWITVRRNKGNKRKNLANIDIVNFDSNLGLNQSPSSPHSSPNRHILNRKIDENINLCKQVGVEFDVDPEVVRRELGMIHGPQESKCEGFDPKQFRLIWGEGNIHGVFADAVGKAGGLISIWRDDFFQMDSSIISQRILIILGSIRALDMKCAFVNVYAPNNDEERRVFFEELSMHLSVLNVPTCICGDFNVVKSEEERSGTLSNDTALGVFNDFIEDWALVDLPLVGSNFTWFENSSPPSFSRIDRFLFAPIFLTTFPNVFQKALPRSLSDHNPILLGCEEVDWGPKPFKLFNFWCEDDDFKLMVKTVWSNSQNSNLWEKLKSLKPALKAWASTKFGNLAASISSLEVEIQQMEELLAVNGENESLRNKLYHCKGELWKLMRAEERSLHQKSRVNWLNNGDKNSRFFHQKVAMRNASNNITSIQHNNFTITDPSEIKSFISSHFENLYNSRNALKIRNFDGRFNSLSDSSRIFLETPFTSEEIFEAINVSDGNKSPGPDGFNLHFFKKNWDIVRTDLLKIFDDFFHSGSFDKKINSSFISLIPKCASPSSISDYRPISLVGSIYKIISKVLARRLSTVITEVIGESQFAFIKGRQIIDCALLANETIDCIKRRGTGGVLFKVDFEKAYDSVDWGFLSFTFGKFGFRTKWISWMESCVSTATLSVLVNGVPAGLFGMQRGLRQGCPLSPYLFCLVGEMLNVMLENAANSNLFKGVQIGNSNLSISHLQYADDTVIFCEPCIEQIRNVKNVLICFQLVSGLKVNFNKSRLYGIGVDDSSLQGWANDIGCKFDYLPSVYLGLPLGARHSSVAIWRPVIEIFSLPIYYMSLFPLPAMVKVELDKIQRRFLWGGSDSQKKLHYVNWNQVCKPKENGGLDIVDLDIKNRGLLKKWVWRFGNEKDSLWRKIIVEKGKLNPLDLQPRLESASKCSPIWKNILIHRRHEQNDLVSLSYGMALIVGNGKNIKFCYDHWIGDRPLNIQFPRIFSLVTNKEARIADLRILDDSDWKWSIRLRRNLFNWEIEQWENFQECIRDIVVNENFADKADNHFDIWKLVWPDLAPPKVHVLLWQIIHGKLAVKVELAKRNILRQDQAFCSLCPNEHETIDHLFFNCHSSWEVWSFFCKQWNVSWASPYDAKSFTLSWLKPAFHIPAFEVWKLLFFAILWSLWLRRNEGKPGPGGIGGILRDHDGKSLLEFSKSVGMIESNEAELRAIREALLIYSTSSWASSHPLILESDSSNACGWARNPFVVPWRFRSYAISIAFFKEKISSLSIVNIPRKQNTATDALAKSGV